MSDPITFGSLERVQASEVCSQGGRKPGMPQLVGHAKLEMQQESGADTCHPTSSKYVDSVNAQGYPMVAVRNSPGGTGIHGGAAEAMPQTPILKRPDSVPRESDRRSMGYISHSIANKVNRSYQGGPNNARGFRPTGHAVGSAEVDHSVPYYYYCYYPQHSSMAPPTQHNMMSFDMKDERRRGGNYGAQDMEDLKRLVVDAMEGEIEGILKNASFVPRQNAFTCLLQLTGKTRQGDKAMEVFEVMRGSCGISPNTFSYSALISALARSGQWEAAEQYFKEMKDAASENDECRPNTVTYASMISAYEKAGKLDRALEVFGEQIDAGVEPDVITYASLLNACCKAHDLETAADLVDAMHYQGISGPQQMYHSLISNCTDKWQLGLEIFLGMQCAGVEVSQQTLNLVMGCLCAGRQKDHAMWLLEQTEMANMVLNAVEYVNLLSLCAEEGDYWAADAVYRCAVKAGIPVDGSIAGLVLSAHIAGRDSKESIETLNRDFEGVGISPVLPAMEEVVGSGAAGLSGDEPISEQGQIGVQPRSDFAAICSIDSVQSEVTDVELA